MIEYLSVNREACRAQDGRNTVSNVAADARGLARIAQSVAEGIEAGTNANAGQLWIIAENLDLMADALDATCAPATE